MKPACGLVTIIVSSISNWSLSVRAVRLKAAAPKFWPACTTMEPGAEMLKSSPCAVPGKTVSGMRMWRWALTPLAKVAVTVTRWELLRSTTVVWRPVSVLVSTDRETAVSSSVMASETASGVRVSAFPPVLVAEMVRVSSPSSRLSAATVKSKVVVTRRWLAGNVMGSRVTAV